MYQVHGLNKVTFQYELIGVFMSKQELDRVFEEEREGYFYMKVTRGSFRR